MCHQNICFGMYIILKDALNPRFIEVFFAIEMFHNDQMIGYIPQHKNLM